MKEESIAEIFRITYQSDALFILMIAAGAGILIASGLLFNPRRSDENGLGSLAGVLALFLGGYAPDHWRVSVMRLRAAEGRN